MRTFTVFGQIFDTVASSTQSIAEVACGALESGRDKDCVQSPPRRLTDLESRRIVYSLHHEIRTLPGEFLRFHHSKAVIFDQELFRPVPGEKRADHHDHARYQPKCESHPANAVE